MAEANFTTKSIRRKYWLQRNFAEGADICKSPKLRTIKSLVVNICVNTEREHISNETSSAQTNE